MDGQMALSIQLIAGLTVALAHMVERTLCKREARGSIPLSYIWLGGKEGEESELGEESE